MATPILDSSEATVCFAGTHGDAFEFFEFAEEVFNQVSPFIHFGVERDGYGAARVLGNDDPGTTFIKIGDDVVAVESFVCEQRPKLDTFDQRCNTDAIETIAWHQAEAHEVAQGVGECQYLGRQAAFGAANGLARSPPFAPCP